ncbi:choline-sulfatase [Bacteroides ovatus]|uniref:sulfatase-like hydrolase/transferase n=1 Tax=Bacteroides ovatus TaxID=28116 RepID=UPI0007601635|nr:sulfatase-like hydrolase/transferase [Bacteroides ovatus]KWR55947.1 choline-sulfatase [Bacteroides ovatus]
MNKSFHLASAIAFTALFSSCVKDTVKDKPNLLIIMTDEHSIRTLGCYRNYLADSQKNLWGESLRIETPNIDRLAAEGALCLNFYSSAPVSTPARASFQTGLYPASTGAPINGMAMDANLETFADVLAENGYSTTYVGKWHLAGVPKLRGRMFYESGYSFGWQDRRFMFESDHEKWYKVVEEPNRIHITNSRAEDTDGYHYSTDFLTDKAIELLSQRDERPFCLMLSIPDPHSPDLCQDPYVSQYAGIELKTPETNSKELLDMRPGWGVGGKAQAERFEPGKVKNYFAMVKCIDENVGKILAYLDNNNLDENTIVVFTADHGDMLYNHMRVDKGCPYDDAVRVPFIIRYPSVINKGKLVKRAYSITDFAPTVLGLMGMRGIENVHGINDCSTLTNSSDIVPADRMVYITDSPFSEWTAVTDGRYKLVLSCKEKPWLLDIEKDPLETVNYYEDLQYSEIRDRLQKHLLKSMESYDDPALKLGRPFLYNTSDSVTYVSPYHGMNRKQINKIEKETLDRYVLEMYSDYYRKY